MREIYKKDYCESMEKFRTLWKVSLIKVERFG